MKLARPADRDAGLFRSKTKGYFDKDDVFHAQGVEKVQTEGKMRSFKPTLREMFEGFLDEADIDFSKFQQHQPKGRPPDASLYTTADQALSQYAPPEEKAKPAESKFLQVCPQPREGEGALDLAQAKQLGLRKLTNWYVSPNHWERAKPNGYDAINWEGNDWIAPKSTWAKQLVRAIHYSGMRPVEIHKKENWDRFAKKDLGPWEKPQ